MTVNELRAIAEKYTDLYRVVCVRTQDVPFELGRIYHESKVWDDGFETDDYVGGISATSINSKALKMHSDEHDCFSGFYPGDYQAIVCGNRYEIGEDEGEIIIVDAVVVEILK